MTKWQKILLAVFFTVVALLYIESILSIRLEHYEPNQYQTNGKTYGEQESLLSRIFVANFEAIWRWFERNDKSIIGLFTVLLVIVTAILAAYTGGLWKATVELQTDARTTARRELRAYLGIKDPLIGALGEGRFQARFTIENTGRTPARDVRHVVHIWIGNHDGPAGGFRVGQLVERTPLNPGAQREIRRVIRELRDEDIPRVAAPDRQRDVFVWGRLEYLDIYSETQHVNFRFVTREVSLEVTLDRDTGHVTRRISGWALQPTDDGNDAS